MMLFHLVLLTTLLLISYNQGYGKNCVLLEHKKGTDKSQPSFVGKYRSISIQKFPHKRLVTNKKTEANGPSFLRQYSGKEESKVSLNHKPRWKRFSIDQEAKLQSSYQESKSKDNLNITRNQADKPNENTYTGDIAFFKFNDQAETVKPHDSPMKSHHKMEEGGKSSYSTDHTDAFPHISNEDILRHRLNSTLVSLGENPTVIKHNGHRKNREVSDNSYVFVYQRPNDYYRCDVCLCHKFNERVHTDCSHKLLNQTPVLPYDIEFLDLSHNRLQLTGFKSFFTYESLITLILSFTSTTMIESVMPPCSFTSGVRNLDLSNNGLETIGENSFLCFPKLESLNLYQNRLLGITTSTFTGIPNLFYLNISHSTLNSIHSRSFDNLGNLEILDFRRNKHLDYSSQYFSPRIFQALKKVKILHIEGHLHSGEIYPTASLAEMTLMEELHIDGVAHAIFDTNMRKLNHLKSLTIGFKGNCYKMNFTNSFFNNMPYLTSIKVTGCIIVNLSTDLYKPVPFLKHLVFSNFFYSFDDLFTHHFKALRNSSIRSLTINRVKELANETACRTLSAAHVQHLTHMRSLQELYIEHNKISLVKKEFIDNLPKSLRHISFNGNSLSFLKSVLPKTRKLINLISIEEKAQNYYEGTAFPHDDSPYSFSQNSSKATCNCNTPQNSVDPTDVDIFDKPYFVNRQNVLLIDTSAPNLQYYSSAYSFHFGRLFGDLEQKSPMRKLNLSNTYQSFPRHKQFLFKGMEIADFSTNSWDQLTNHFFPLNNSLKEVHMAGNFLGNDLSIDVRGERFSRLNRVLYLDLSKNQIRDLPSDIFKGLFNLQVLLLSKNSIRVFNVSMAHMKSLFFLDLNTNSISWIGKQSRHALDLISLDHEVSLDLTSNPLPCTCHGIEILKWLETTKVRIINKDFLECVDEENKNEFIGDLTTRTRALQRYCLSKALLTFISVMGVLSFLIITGSVLTFRNRWRLHYIKNVFITKYFGYKPKNANKQYTFDAYILYTEEDRHFVLSECIRELEEKRSHKLCIEDRDFLPGSFISVNIISAIQNSSVTLPVISPDFWQGEWTEYSLQMSVIDAISSKRRVLHLLLYKEVPIETMPADLIKVHKDNDFIEYPPLDCNEEVKTAFWDALSRIIGHNSNSEENPRLAL